MNALGEIDRCFRSRGKDGLTKLAQGEKECGQFGRRWGDAFVRGASFRGRQGGWRVRGRIVRGTGRKRCKCSVESFRVICAEFHISRHDLVIVLVLSLVGEKPFIVPVSKNDNLIVTLLRRPYFLSPLDTNPTCSRESASGFNRLLCALDCIARVRAVSRG
jgi:hypothetical protein